MNQSAQQADSRDDPRGAIAASEAGTFARHEPERALCDASLSPIACPLPGATLGPMRAFDVEAVALLEREIYPFPWTLGNFYDSIAAGYGCSVLRAGDDIAAYAVTMATPDDLHLLNISVGVRQQGRGLGRWLLGALMAQARSVGHPSMLLEVRVSNHGAQRLYRSLGFAPIGMRRRYYPSFNNTREDAIVMRCHFDAQ